MKHGYLKNPSSHGYQPPHRWSGKGNRTGLLFHAYGCRADGGDGLPPGMCQKCADTIELAWFRALMRIDRRVRI